MTQKTREHAFKVGDKVRLLYGPEETGMDHAKGDVIEVTQPGNITFGVLSKDGACIMNMRNIPVGKGYRKIKDPNTILKSTDQFYCRLLGSTEGWWTYTCFAGKPVRDTGIWNNRTESTTYRRKVS